MPRATAAWGNLLIVTSGALKPAKRFCYLVDYEWAKDGSWSSTELVDPPAIKVPFPDGSSAPIDQLPVGESKKMLGTQTNPAGECQGQLDVIYDSLKKWTNRLTAGPSPQMGLG